MGLVLLLLAFPAAKLYDRHRNSVNTKKCIEYEENQKKGWS